MTDSIQQNLENPGRGNGDGSKRTQFKRGYDKRRWLAGRGKKSPEQREGEEILRAVIWEELSREFEIVFDGQGKERIKAVDSEDKIDALRLMVRQWIKKQPEQVANRVAGKLTDRVDVTSNGKEIKGYAIVSPDDWKKKDDGE